jgi:hypothetical protein
MNKSKLGVLTIVTVLLLSFGSVAVRAQYQTEKTTNVTIGSDGTFNATEADVGISYQINGTAGATGSVTADVYNGNPQPTATIPAGASLSHFIVITFNMNANDFEGATIVISYSDSDVAGISGPYAIYKYNANSNSYVALPSTVDTVAKAMTVTVTSLSDPLFAIGGATESSGGVPTSTWIIIAVSVIVVVLVAVFVVRYMRSHSEKSSDSEYSFKS